MTTRSVLGLFRERSWLGALLGVMALSAVFVLLGQWQLHRRHERDARNAVVVRNYAAEPVPLGTVLDGPGTPLPAGLQWRPVRVSGQYLAADTLLVRNRPLGEQAGYEVLVPLRTDSGAVLVVDRGWVPAGRTGAGPDTVAPAPAGRVDLVVRLRGSEDAGTRSAPTGQVPAVDLGRIADRLRLPLYGAYGVLAAESPRPQQAPTLLPRPVVTPGPHLAYAVQWYGFAVTAFVMLWVLASREVARRQGPGTAATGRVAAGSRRRLRGLARAGRISDEEAEDIAQQTNTG